jgi:hypothetical protein
MLQVDASKQVQLANYPLAQPVQPYAGVSALLMGGQMGQCGRLMEEDANATNS